MQLWIALPLLCVVASPALGATSSFCPETCTCPAKNEARCTTIQFAKKDHPTARYKSLFKLDVSNTSITKLNVDLSTFTNLKHLNLAWNKIQHVSPPFLPLHLEVLDLSHNYLKYFPRNLHILPRLKEVFLEGNPIHCDCDAASVLEELRQSGVHVHPIKCEYPKKYKGLALQSVKCQHYLFGGMQGDSPYEGSGSEDPKIEDEYIIPDVTSSDVVTEEGIREEEEEGSGEGVDDITDILEEYDGGSSTTTDEYDYGSNENMTDVNEPVIVPVDKSDLGSVFVKPCNFECSTPSPINTGNETGESPSPNLVDGLLIIANDLGFIDDSKNSSTTQLPAKYVEDSTTAETTVDNPADRTLTTDSGLYVNDNVGRASVGSESNSQTAYICLGLLVIAIACVILYVFVKRMRRTNHPTRQNGEEKIEPTEKIELLTKPPVDNGNKNGTPEVVPLINGNTDNKTNEDDDDGKAVNESEPKNDEGVELRKPPRKNIPVPTEMKRVTIKAREIPNSTPKTPVLVTRHLNSDGDIITTPNVNQDV